MSRVLGWLFNRTVLAIVGLVVLAILIWVLGPGIHFGKSNWSPLESEIVRIALIALIVAVWLAVRLVRWWQERSRNAALLKELAKEAPTAEGSPSGVAGTEEVAELRKRFETALTTLRKSRVGGGPKGFGSRFSRRYIYQMPWYVFIGAPGSGKTTALVNSGLEFPLADKLGKAAVRGIGGTRNCDWWFTNEAVLLDTAGRYTTQESNQALDKAEWEGFLGLLRKYRPRAPINGVLLTLSVADILGSGDEERARHATALRRRLTELCDLLRVRFPVYLVVTKTDLLAGFAEYLDRLAAADRAQVWGLTFPLEPAIPSAAALVQAFRNEYALLQQRLESALPDHLQAEPDVARRALAYAFTQEFAGLRELIEPFLTTLATESKFAEAPLIRGIYFTSGTQEGTPIDRVLGAIQRRFGVEARVQSATAAKGAGRSFFLKGLLQDLVFAEWHLVARDPARDRRRRIVQAVGVATVTLALIGISIAWVVSYSNNRAYLAEIEPKVVQLARDVQGTAGVPPDDPAALLPVLDEARVLAQSERLDIESPPLSYRFGMYQGGKVAAAAAAVYNQLLENTLLPRIATRLERLLAEVKPDDAEASYERLKAYLMMHEPSQYRPAYLNAAVTADLHGAYGNRLSADQFRAMDGHVQHLFSGEQIRQSPLARNDALIKETRNRLSQETQAKRLYRQLKGSVSERLGRADFSLIGVVGPDARNVFARKSGAPLDQGVEAVFTRDGYRALQERLNDRRLLLQLDETWVLGRPARSAANTAADVFDERLISEIRIEYLKEYRNAWEKYLADVRLRPATNAREWSELLQNLSAGDSPLVKFVRAVAEETKLAEVGKQAAGLADKVTEAAKQAGTSALNRVFSSAGSITSGSSNDQLKSGQVEATYVDRYFEQWQRLAAPGAGGADQLTGLLKQAYDQAQATEYAVRRGNLPPPNDTSPRLQAEGGRLPPPLKEIFETIAVNISAQTDTGTRERVGAEINAAVGEFCRMAIAGRYPIVRDAAKDISLDDFATMFGPGGKMEAFFQKNLASQVDTTTRPLWTYKRGMDASGGGGTEYLRSFQYAEKIRDTYFRGGARTPGYRIQIKLTDVDPAVTNIQLDVDGQVISMNPAAGLTAHSVSWPGTRGSYEVSLRYDTAAAQGSELVFRGPWALQRMFDRAKIEPLSAERFKAEIQANGRYAKFEVYAGSVLNPLMLPELKGFSCPTQR